MFLAMLIFGGVRQGLWGREVSQRHGARSSYTTLDTTLACPRQENTAWAPSAGRRQPSRHVRFIVSQRWYETH